MERSRFEIIKSLLRKHLQGELTPQEQEQLDNWVQESDGNRLFFERMSDENRFEQEFRQFVQSREKILAALKQQIPVLQNSTTITGSTTGATGNVRRMNRWSWAAAVLLVLGAGTWLWTKNTPTTPEKVAVIPASADIAPGKSGAVLTLANGMQVQLDSLDGGIIATQNGSRVVLRNGQLAYDPAGTASGAVQYNTMSTPKGRQFELVLPDGSRIWLNAASSVKFPTSFVGTERRISITGEVYIEVAKSVNKPFKVDIDSRGEVEVLGTHFNINAYSNEPVILTTLLEGAVRMKSKTAAGTILKPGQQASMEIGQADRAVITVSNKVDMDRVMAWKNGMFYFEGASLREIMRQLERWYDIEVVYEKDVKNVDFVGGITRDVSLSGLLLALDKSDIHYRLENRKLIIMP